jgi:hypothetical protein
LPVALLSCSFTGEKAMAMDNEEKAFVNKILVQLDKLNNELKNVALSTNETVIALNMANNKIKAIEDNTDQINLTLTSIKNKI